MIKTKEELINENKVLLKNKNKIKDILFRFRQEGRSKMVVINSELFLPNKDFDELSEKIINKFRVNKIKGGNK